MNDELSRSPAHPGPTASNAVNSAGYPGPGRSLLTNGSAAFVPTSPGWSSRLGLVLATALLAGACWAQAPAGVKAEQLQTAQRVAQQGVALTDLAPNAPESHTVKAGDTLWGLSQLFLKSPWRWAELWGMNLEQIRNPHRIYPGQLLVLFKAGDRATLKLAQPVVSEPPLTDVKLRPQVRSSPIESEAIASVPMHLIAPFLTDSAVLAAGDIDGAPRLVATQEGRVMLSQGETGYVRGDLKGQRSFQLVREPRPLRDPRTKEVLGYEARLVGHVEVLSPEQTRSAADGKPVVTPARVLIKEVRLEAGVGDRLTAAPAADFAPFVPRAPAKAIEGQVIGLYGDGLSAGQNQVVSLNRGLRDGLEKGHVLALWRAGRVVVDRTDPARTTLQLPDEKRGQLFVFRVFDRVSYALILDALEAVSSGDRFSQP